VNTLEALKAEKVEEVRAEFEERGFNVVRDPGQELVPFDLDFLHPDLLASDSDAHILVFVRESAEWVSLSRLRDLMREVRKHQNWDLLLVTADDDIKLVGPAGAGDALPPWPEMRAQASRAIAFVHSGTDADVAFLILWAAVEGVLRKTAMDADLPVDRLPTEYVIPAVYDYGYLSIEQYPRMQAALRLRNRVAHGFPACSAELEDGIKNLMEVLTSLLPQEAALAA